MLELIRLLGEAAEVEHALALQYLYMAFSVKEEFRDVQGFPKPGVGGLFGIAVEEMIHLGRVNRILVQLGAAPVMHRQDFPYEPEFYPFEFKLEPLSASRLLAFILTEAPAEFGGEAWNLLTEGQRTELAECLGTKMKDMAANRLGVLYGALLELLKDPALQIDESIRQFSQQSLYKNVLEGEGSHFNILVGIWQTYFAGDASMKQSALTVPLQSVPPAEIASSVITLTDKIYWLICGLLHLGYLEAPAKPEADVKQLATSLMMRALLPLGRFLAQQGVGLRFAELSLGYSFGGETSQSKALLLILCSEILREMKSLTGAVFESLPWKALDLVFRDLSLALQPALAAPRLEELRFTKHEWETRAVADTVPDWRKVDAAIGELKYQIIVAPSAPQGLSDTEIRAYQLFWRSLHVTEEDIQVVDNIDNAEELRFAWETVVLSYLGSEPSLPSFAAEIDNSFKKIYANEKFAHFKEFCLQMVLYQNKLVSELLGSLANTDPDLGEPAALRRLFTFFATGTLGVLFPNGKLERVHLMDGNVPHYNYGNWHALNWAGQLAQDKVQLEPWQRAMPRALGILRSTPRAPVNEREKDVLTINRYPTDNEMEQWGCLQLPEQFALEQWIHKRVT